jgi:hypothetical protein
MTLTRRSFLAAYLSVRLRRAARPRRFRPNAILILISIDGFRADYLIASPPTLSKLAAKVSRPTA